MVITYYGISCFKIQSGEMVLVFDPPSKKSGFKAPRFQADVVFVSHQHEKHNGFESLAGKEKDIAPFLINGPGEYETKGMVVRGLRTFHDSVSGKKNGLNTSYILNLENLNICHLGDLGEKELRTDIQEFLGKVDILFVPIGGGSVLETEKAVKIINQIEPKIIVPMHYITSAGKMDKKKLNEFLKEMGQEKVKPVEKLTFRKKDIADKSGEVVILKPLIN